MLADEYIGICNINFCIFLCLETFHDNIFLQDFSQVLGKARTPLMSGEAL